MWECTRCGRCCKMIVSIDGEDVRTIENLGYTKFTEEKDGEIILKKNDDKCVFLADDNKCRIQTKHGYEFKPKLCRRFPDSSIGVNQVVCGKFSGEIESISRIKEFTFRHGKGSISSEVLSYTISKLGEDYMNQMYTILSGIKIKENITKEDVDEFIKNTKKISKLEKIILYMTLAGYSRGFYPALIKIPAKSKIYLTFPCEKLTLNPKEYRDIKIHATEINKFMIFLSKGNGILYNEKYPKHLLFCFMFLDRFSRQIAFNNSRKKVEFSDIVNAFSILNSVAKFS